MTTTQGLLSRRPTVPALAREQWTSHEHYPSQVLLLGSHRQFRRISRTLVSRALSGGDTKGILWVFRQWKSAMAGHEAYEEYKLYPFLEHRWDLSLAEAERGHHQLAVLTERVEAEATAGKATAGFAEALRAHDEALEAHLDLEESLVIPALLALTPEEFARYYSSDIVDLLT